MSGNVPVAQPPSGLEAWRHSLPWWELYFAAVTAATVIFAVTAPAAIFLLAMVAWYVGLGRRVIRGQHAMRPATVYTVGNAILLIPAVWLDTDSAFMLFALSPLAHMALAFTWGTIANIATNLMPTAILLLRGKTWTHALIIATAAIVLSTVMGYSFDKVIDQSMQLAQSRAEVARLSREAERQRLGADLHDTIAQGLSSVVMLVQAADAALDRDKAEARRHLDLAALTARENLKEIRAVLDALMPAGEDLPSALRRLTAREGAKLVVSGQPRPLPIPAEVVLLRAAQESLANAQRHASASQVSVGLSFDPGSVRLQIRDNGQGFDPSQTFAGYGISAMKSRVTQAGGQFTVTSEPGDTRISVEVPA